MFEQAFKNIDDVLWKEAGCTTELDQEKLTPLLKLKYQDSIADAIADLGKPDEIGKVFSDFQKYLYEQQAVA